jgi:putative membrane protein
MYGFDHGGWMFGGGLWMLLSWLLPVALIVAAIYVLARPGQGTREKTALDILKERYARGEIEKEEFEQKKRDLGG